MSVAVSTLSSEEWINLSSKKPGKSRRSKSAVIAAILVLEGRFFPSRGLMPTTRTIQFMVPMRDCEVVEAFHEPRSRTVPDPQRPRTLNFVAADVRRLILFGAKEVGASLSWLLRVHGFDSRPNFGDSPSHEPGGARLRRALIFCRWEIRARRSLAPPFVVPDG